MNHGKKEKFEPFKKSANQIIQKENEMNAKLSKISFSILLAVLLALVSAFLAPQTARAATCTVTSALDDGSVGTLRALLADATCDTITFADDMIIHLANELDLTRNVSIDGGTYQVVLSGDTNDDGTGEVRVLDLVKVIHDGEGERRRRGDTETR